VTAHTSEQGASGTTVVGLLGAVAAGKSTVARIMVEAGAQLVDADVIAHEVLARPEVKRSLERSFGRGVFTPEGRVDRAKLARVVFGPDAEGREQRERLNAIVHPPVLEEIAKQVREARGREVALVVLDAPLLMEKGLERHCDMLVFVEASEALRAERAQKERDWAGAEVSRRDAAQIPAPAKKQKADLVIQNAGTKEELRTAVRSLVQQITSARKG